MLHKNNQGLKSTTVLFVLIAMAPSCSEKEEVMPRWPYKFVATNAGSKTLTWVWISSSISYPLEDSTHISVTSKHVYGPVHDEFYLHEFDSVKLPYQKKVYPGCVARMYIKADVLLGEDKTSFYYYTLDTIKGYKDSLSAIVWPRDSTLFTTDRNQITFR